MDMMGRELSKKSFKKLQHNIKNNKNLTNALLVYKMAKYRLHIQYK